MDKSKESTNDLTPKDKLDIFEALKQGETQEKKLKKQHRIFYDLITECRRVLYIESKMLAGAGQLLDEKHWEHRLGKIKEKVESLREKNPNLIPNWSKGRNSKDEITEIHRWAIRNSSETASGGGGKGSRIGNFFWKLYEKTLKVAIDAVLEKVLPK